KIATAWPSITTVLDALAAPSAAIFTYGKFVASASESSEHGLAFVHAVLVPLADTYATSLALAQAPLGRHTLESVHSACAVQARHICSSPHTGVVPVHASALSVVHCTHAP